MVNTGGRLLLATSCVALCCVAGRGSAAVPAPPEVTASVAATAAPTVPELVPLESAPPAAEAAPTVTATVPAPSGHPLPPPMLAPGRSPYADREWLRYFWSDPDRAAASLPDELKPKTRMRSPGLLAAGIVLLVGSPVSLFAGVGKTVDAMGGIWDCDTGDVGCESDRSTQRTLGALGIVGGLLGVATGLAFTIVGATGNVWVDPNGDPVPKPEDLGARRDAPLRVDLAASPGFAGLRGTF